MRRHRLPFRLRRPAVAMMYAILVVALAAIVGYGFVASQSTSLAIAENIVAKDKARMVAESGIELALGYIRSNDDWRTVQSDGMWINGAALLGGTITVLGEDGIDTDHDGDVDGDGDLTDDETDLLTLTSTGTVNGVTHVARAVVTPVAVPTTNMLFVVPNPANLKDQDEDRVDLFESWGYKVNLIDSDDSHSDFDDAITENTLIYISSDVDTSLTASKIDDAEIGIVNEENGLYDDFSLASSHGTYSGTTIDIVDNTHEITSSFSTGNLTILTSSQSLRTQTGTLAAGAVFLAERPSSSDASFTIVEQGGTLIDGSPAAGRRVILPWGLSTFEVSALNADGVTFLKNTLQWAASTPSSPTPIDFGNTSEYSSDQKSVQNTQLATQVTLGQDATLTAISAYVKGPSPKKLRYAIYADSGGEPGTLIAETTVEAVGSNSFHWHEISIGPTALNAGTYWLALAFEHNNMYYKYTSSGQSRTKDRDAVDNGFSAPWGPSDSSPTRSISIYGIATPQGGGGGGSGGGSISYIYPAEWR